MVAVTGSDHFRLSIVGAPQKADHSEAEAARP